MSNRILVLTAHPADANTLKTALGQAKDGPFKIVWARKLSSGLKRLRKGDIDAILVELSLPDSTGIATFDQLFAVAPHVPILTLSDDKDEALAVEAVERGAQGHLSKGHYKSALVPQALRNIIHRKAVEEALLLDKTRAEIALNSIGDSVICIDTAGNVNYLNIAAEKMTGWPREEAQGRPIKEVFHLINGITRQRQYNPSLLVLKSDQPSVMPADTVLVRRDGSEAPIEDSTAPIHDWNGKLTGAVIVFHDVSEAQAMSEKMTHLAQHDFLTDLPNRLLLNDRMSQAISMAKRGRTKLAVLFLDLDNFKQINDTLGHATGDTLLQSVTQRLGNCVRDSDTISRQGGDEFVVLLGEVRNGEAAALIADKILAELALPQIIPKEELQVTASIGISIYPTDGEDADTLIKHADTAMYHAKEKGRNNYQFFKGDMNDRAVERQLVETNLRRALKKQEFVLHYQPKVNLHTGKITGAEALLRWTHAEWGTVLPGTFVDIAEDCGLIVPIGRWVLREACTQAKKWIDAGLGPLFIAVNISAMEFRQKDFFESVRTVLEDTGLEAHCLQLEITESVVMHDAEYSGTILQKLKDLGVQLAVDDFGTGYSSLSYLKQLPIDVLKIDQSFVSDIKSPADEGTIVSAVIAMGNSLNLRVVAEGVENQMQLAFLKARQCQEGQGYLLGRPISVEQFTALLATGIPTTDGKHPQKSNGRLYGNSLKSSL